MPTCEDNVCGTGLFTGGVVPLPSDPDNNSILTAIPAFGGIDVSWSYPGINPHAVAHTLLFRARKVLVTDPAPVFADAVQHAIVAGNFFYDKVATEIQYYYWIRFVSVNGTLFTPIGPATARANPLIEDLIELLTAKIDAGVLAQSLKTEIDKITLNYAELTQEISNRIAGNAALASAMAAVQAGTQQALAFIQEEITTRTEGDNALVNAVNVVAAANASNVAAIIQEQTVRVSAVDSLSQTINSVSAATNQNAASIQQEAQARTAADSVLSQQITTAQSSLNGSIASVQQTLQTNINAVDGEATALGALYHVKVNVNGLAGGFGIYNNGTEVEAGFDVDRFWIGRTQGNRRKPFIVQDNIVYIDEAAINKLTFSKLRDEAGSFIVENGRVKANYLRVGTASIDNAAITNAQIATAAVDTLKIGGNAITVPQVGTSAGASAATTVNFSAIEATNVLIWGVCSGVVLETGGCTIRLYLDGVEIKQTYSNSAGGVIPTITLPILTFRSIAAGTHTLTCDVRNNVDALASAVETTIVVMGAKR